MELDDIPQQDLAFAREYVKTHSWREAITFKSSAPHEYTLCQTGDPDRPNFKRMFTLIEKYGREEKFYGRKWLYLYLGDGYKYFSADGGGWLEDRVVLNRCKETNFYGRQ